MGILDQFDKHQPQKKRFAWLPEQKAGRLLSYILFMTVLPLFFSDETLLKVIIRESNQGVDPSYAEIFLSMVGLMGIIAYAFLLVNGFGGFKRGLNKTVDGFNIMILFVATFLTTNILLIIRYYLGLGLGAHLAYFLGYVVTSLFGLLLLANVYWIAANAIQRKQ